MVENSLCSYFDCESFTSSDLNWLLGDNCLVGVSKTSYNQINFRAWETILFNQKCSQIDGEWTTWNICVSVGLGVIVPRIYLDLQSQLIVKDINLKSESKKSSYRMRVRTKEVYLHHRFSVTNTIS